MHHEKKKNWTALFLEFDQNNCMTKKYSKIRYVMVSTFVFFAALIGYQYFDLFIEPPSKREPTSINIESYESQSACSKQDLLWQKILESSYNDQDLPPLRKFGIIQLIAMNKQQLQIKGRIFSDFAPPDWKKYIHGRGAISKVKIVPTHHNYTGIFQGADCALLRLSLTFRPTSSRAVAPGLALKVLRDGTYSGNVSALVSLGGQENDYNFFANSLSNIVPKGDEFGQKLFHRMFSRASDYPEELILEDLASIDSKGLKSTQSVYPRQLFFVPSEKLKMSSEPHDFRKDLLKIPQDTLLYKVYVASEKYQNFDYGNYTENEKVLFMKDASHIADIVTTSEFKASEFGDDGIFFKHQLRP